VPYGYRWGAWRRWTKTGWHRIRRATAVRRFVQRGRRGWCDEDLWNFDHHISRVIIGGFRQLADTTHGWPGTEEFPKFEDWQAFLRQIADDLESWDLNNSFADRDAFDRAKAAMRRVAEQYGHYWD